MEENYHRIEKKVLIDDFSGRRVFRWTNSSSNSQHQYFTSATETDDGKYLVIISERTGSPNLFVINKNTGEMRQISHASSLLQSYAYPYGGTSGFSKPSPIVDKSRNYVYWIQDDYVWGCSVEEGGIKKKIASLPRGWWTAYTSISSDGSKLCIPCTDPRAFSQQDKTQRDQLLNVPWRMLEKNLMTRLYIVDVFSLEVKILGEIPFWVTHVQYNPKESDYIVFNREGAIKKIFRRYPYYERIWKIDMEGNWSLLYKQDHKVVINHENWNSEYGYLIFHGTEIVDIFDQFKRLFARILKKINIITGLQLQQSLNHFVEARNINGNCLFHINVDFAVNHAIALNRGNGFIADSRDGNIYIYRLSDDGIWGKEILCKHNSSMEVQDAHPHPVMTSTGDSVIFTSDIDGFCNVYEVELKRRTSNPTIRPVKSNPMNDNEVLG